MRPGGCLIKRFELISLRVSGVESRPVCPSGTRLRFGLGQTGGCDGLRGLGNGVEVGSAPEGTAGAGWRGEAAGCGDARQRSCPCTPAVKTLCWGEAPAEAFET